MDDRAMARPLDTVVSALSLGLLVLLAAAIFLLADSEDLARRIKMAETPQRPVPSTHEARPADPRLAEIEQRFQQAVVMLHARRYEHAATALHRVIALSPRLTEAYVNMGYALLGLRRYPAAGDFFRTAIDLNPYQANAYWGLGIALEQQGDLPAALGAMRSFIHLSPPDDPYVRRARSALWEWESTLKRGPLPEHERAWLDRRTREWEARNSPDQDAPPPGRRLLTVEGVD